MPTTTPLTLTTDERVLRVLSRTLVRAIKDEASPDAEELLLRHLLEVRDRALEECR